MSKTLNQTDKVIENSYSQPLVLNNISQVLFYSLKHSDINAKTENLSFKFSKKKELSLD